MTSIPNPDGYGGQGGIGGIGASVTGVTGSDESLAISVAVGGSGGQGGKPLGRRWAPLFHSVEFWIGAVILLFWIVCAIFGNLFAPDNPLSQNLLSINQAPSLTHLFGTDNLGRDVLSRVIVGARSILIIAPLATCLGVVCGTALGLTQAYYRGVVDIATSRVVEACLALPTVIVAFLFIVAAGPSNGTLIVVVGLTFSLIVSRTVRTAALAERDLDYVAVASLRGERRPYIMFVEIFPNVLPVIVVEFTVRLGYAIFTVASLSFLGFGVQPPTPNWGADVAANYQYLAAGYWWETLFPALAIVSLIMSINMVSNAIERTVLRYT